MQSFSQNKNRGRIYAVTERSCVSRSNSVTATNDSDKINDRLRAFFFFYSLSGIRSDASRDLEVRMNLLEKYGDKHWFNFCTILFRENEKEGDLFDNDNFVRTLRQNYLTTDLINYVSQSQQWRSWWTNLLLSSTRSLFTFQSNRKNKFSCIF